MGLKRSVMDQCIYFDMKNDKPTIVSIYVDDILIFTAEADEEEKIVNELSKHLKMKDLGEVSSVLGVRIKRNKTYGTISICQPRYIDDMLNTFGLTEYNPVSTPVDVNQKISSEMSLTTKEEQMEMSKIPYRQLVGSLLFIAQISRPDINFIVNLLSRYCENSGMSHWRAAKRVLR